MLVQNVKLKFKKNFWIVEVFGRIFKKFSQLPNLLFTRAAVTETFLFFVEIEYNNNCLNV